MVKYGTVTKITKPTLPKALPNDHDDFPVGIVRLILTAVEVGVAIFTGGAAVPVELVISEIFGAANEGLDAASDNLSIQGSLLNFALPFMTSYLAGVRNSKTLFKAAEDANKYIAPEFLGVENAFIRLDAGKKISEFSESLFDKLRKINALETPTKFSSPKSIKNYVNTIVKEYKDLERIGRIKFVGEKWRVVKYTGRAKDGLGQDIGLLASDNILDALVEDGRSWPKTQLLYKRLGLMAGPDTRALIKKIIQASERPRAKGEIEDIIKDLFKYSNKEDKYVQDIFNMAQKANQWAVSAGEESNLASAFLGTAKSFRPKAKWSFKKSVQEAGLAKTLGSRQFNAYVVQPSQAIMDANDFGRALIENPYQWIWKKIQRGFKKSLKTVKYAEDIKTAFTKAGGVLLNSSWLLGYKVIKTLPGTQYIMITFQPKPWGTKPNVYVWANDWQLEKFITTSPGSTYLKYWAMSKGGRKLSSLGVLNGLDLTIGKSSLGATLIQAESPFFSAFLNIQAWRNVLSIVSNMVENGHDVATGDWSKEWFGKMKKSFVNTAISRSIRLVARTSGLAIGGKFGNMIGRELQRFGTQIGAYSIKQTIAGGKINLKSQFAKAIATSVRTHTLRYARSKNKNSIIIRNIGTRRKARTFLRLPNALAPGRPYRGFRLKKKRR